MILLWKGSQDDVPHRSRAEEMLLFLAALISLLWRSEPLCPPTTFYQNCWIRRFPGLLLDLQESQRRGAQVLRLYPESTAQQCSRSCCLLTNVSCNLAVFYFETLHNSSSCLHVYCPTLESCIIKTKHSAILYNITTGVDPDLLVFEKLSFKDVNTRSSFHKWERQNCSKVPDSDKCQQAKFPSTSRPIQASMASQSLVPDSDLSNSKASSTVQKTELTTDARVKSIPLDYTSKETLLSSEGTQWDNGLENKMIFSTSVPLSTKLLSYIPSPAHLNSSKQHLNETKGYSGKNYSSDSENEEQGLSWTGTTSSWLIPVTLCFSFFFFCCFLLLVAGRRRKRRGYYRTVRKGDTGSKQVIKYTIIRDRI
ncbi:MANSC domain-containing protein 4 [Rhinatrema bivittatum]|uniref:MANSC domain-containing protein 4 n=1 Tax=Rhinatrema bivittatum TaxID=194408 RepID=UPI00112605DD|nr:MANSC domain-containing protein 4 [Rhinatrema bivittatum]